jgi:excisionase family DNA binding protein
MVGTSLNKIRRLLTVPESAELLGISRSKLYEELTLGRIKSVRIGRARRVPTEEIERYLELLKCEAREHGVWPDAADDSSCRPGAPW